MRKVLGTIQTVSYQVIQTEFSRAPSVVKDRKCQICGNGFVALNTQITSCEFCKTSFQAIYSHSYTPLLAL